MPKSTCSIENCAEPAKARGWCSTHHATWRRNGDPTKLVRAKNIGAICSGPECDSGATRKGLCDSHYRMQKRTGRLIPVKADYREWHRGLTLAEVLEAKSDPANERGCRVWAGEINASGYPRFPRRAKSTRQAHRIAYMLASGCDLPRYVPVHHTCGVSLCVEPSHLQAVTPIENTAEMLERNFYLKRIAALEAALMDSMPNHPLLKSVK